MDRDTFWSMIEDARARSAGDIERQHDLLTDALALLPEAEIQEFDRIVWALMAEAFRTDLWEAAFVLSCGCGDDAFYEFRGWLITRGRTVFESALADPDSLSDQTQPEDRFYLADLRILDIGADAYQRKTQQTIPERGYSEKPILIGGKLLSEDDRFAKFPRIVAKFGDCTDDDIFL